jgi:hypothetical protein
VKKYIALAKDYLLNSNSDAIGFAVLNFEDHSFKHFELFHHLESPNLDEGEVFFDLASLTKPLVNSFAHIIGEIQEKNLELLLNHRAGLPAWGILTKDSWQDQLNKYEINECDTLYSDFSALRYMLEFEQIKNKKIYDVVRAEHGDKIKFWKDLKQETVLQNGFYQQKPNIGKVHDPNAFNLNTFTSHAGLFGTIDGLASTLLNFDKKYQLLKKFSKRSSTRFHLGFDTVENPEQTLAGSGCSHLTFGHLGFTGTSFWIDPEKKIGHIILTNATKLYWYDKINLNKLRNDLGKLVWIS